jgi:hypothetical protein
MIDLPELTIVRKSRSAVLTSFEDVIAWKELISQVITHEKDVQPLYNAALSQVKTMETYMRSITDCHISETNATLTIGRYSFTVRVIHQVPTHVREFAEETGAAIGEIYKKYIGKGHSHRDIGPSITYNMDMIRKMIEQSGSENKWKDVCLFSPK